MIVHRDNLVHCIFIAGGMLCLTISVSALSIQGAFPGMNMYALYRNFFLLSILLFLLEGINAYYTLEFRKGFQYGILYTQVTTNLYHQLYDAGFNLKRLWWNELPLIKLSFSKNLMTGTLKIENSVKFNHKLDDLDFSAALGNYKVERHYISKDSNWYIYELLRADVSFKIEFNSSSDFESYSAKIHPYKLFLDARTRCKLQHTLIVGQTGSGKTYALYSLILQMLQKQVPYQLYFADPKGSSIAVLGNAVAPNSTASEFNDIIDLMEVFVDEMNDRKEELADRLHGQLDADFTTFHLEPHVLIIDEYAAFSAVLAAKDKKTRDHVDELMHQIILMGRQLGFFIFLVMQKSDAKLIATALRENVPLKIVLGNAEEQTYVTAFGNGIDIPPMNYTQGDGVFIEPILAPTPKYVQFPILEFDILEKAKRLVGVV